MAENPKFNEYKDEIIKILAKMFDYLALNGDFKVQEKGQRIAVAISSDNAGRIIGRKEAISNYKKEAISLKEKTYSQAKILEKNEFDIKASSKLTQKQRAIDLSKKPNGTVEIRYQERAVLCFGNPCPEMR